MSQADLAKRVGTSQATIDKIERGETQRSKFVVVLARELNISLVDLDPEFAHIDSPEAKTIPKSELVGPKDLPVYAATEGGDGAIIISFEAIDYVRRPAPLLHVREGYGVLVTGESMSPAYRPGDTALVHPSLPVRREDVCIFTGEGGHGQMSTIKEFVSQTDSHWIVKRYKPEEIEFELAKAIWPRCHVVVGKYNRR